MDEEGAWVGQAGGGWDEAESASGGGGSESWQAPGGRLSPKSGGTPCGSDRHSPSGKQGKGGGSVCDDGALLEPRADAALHGGDPKGSDPAGGHRRAARPRVSAVVEQVVRRATVPALVVKAPTTLSAWLLGERGLLAIVGADLGRSARAARATTVTLRRAGPIAAR